jgi:propionate CoA-transferase
MQYWLNKLGSENSTRNIRQDGAAGVIGKRAVQELREGHVVNIGIGIPEMVGACAAKTGILKNITLTVEAGGIGGLPAAGMAFGATIGADMICDMSMLFDFYNGGGLDICFMGALEVDRWGNVNSHRGPKAYSGIGGFANIVSAAKTVVFCLTFNTKGLNVEEKDGVHISAEGSIPKFKKEIRSISFSAKRAVENGQRVLYVTERCVFALTPQGLKLSEAYPGIDAQKDILDKLDFEIIQ